VPSEGKCAIQAEKTPQAATNPARRRDGEGYCDRIAPIATPLLAQLYGPEVNGLSLPRLDMVTPGYLRRARRAIVLSHIDTAR
jgi:hypothetical protein